MSYKYAYLQSQATWKTITTKKDSQYKYYSAQGYTLTEIRALLGADMLQAGLIINNNN